jgi:hypothetical protein
MVVCSLLISAVFGCAQTPPLQESMATPEQVGAAVLEALANQNRPRLERLALLESEFRDHVWPDLPAARPERNLPFSYVWGDLRQKSQSALTATVRDHGGKRYELLGVDFNGTTQYAHYVVHREATFRVRNQSGVEERLRLCGSMLEKDGAWKVFSYVTD